MKEGRIDKVIFPGLMMPPFHYACFTTFTGYSEEPVYTVHNSFQIMVGLRGRLDFELEHEVRHVEHHAGCVFVLGPGIRHRWRSSPNDVCENFMFFCDGFNDTDSDLGRILNTARSDVVWLFDLDLERHSFYLDNFRQLMSKSDLCATNIIHGLLHAFCGVVCHKAMDVYGNSILGEGHPALRKAVEFIHREFRGSITLERLSKHCGIGSSRLSELFRIAYGMSPLQFINELKIKKARQLLTYSDMNVSQIAAYLGFSSVHYFSRFYKKRTGENASTAKTR